MKKQPLRMCVACRSMQEKSNLIKFVKNKEGELSIDLNCNKEGRGAYICKNTKCLDLCIKKKALNRAFKSSIDEDIYSKMRELLNNE